jgi:hypothetical protein
MVAAVAGSSSRVSVRANIVSVECTARGHTLCQGRGAAPYSSGSLSIASLSRPGLETVFDALVWEALL